MAISHDKLRLSSSTLRAQLSALNAERSVEYQHEATYSRSPCFVYQREKSRHGNFCSPAFRAICANPEWAKRLKKPYTAGRRIARSGDRARCELDCANSSDALLMNIFCYPGVLRRKEMCSLLGIDVGARPEFGYKPRTSLVNGKRDHTEVDMRLGSLLVEAKLTETGFQSAPLRLLLRYPDFQDIFNVQALQIGEGVEIGQYQIIRGVLAAHATGYSFALMCDERRSDLMDKWFSVMKAIQLYELRCRIKLVTWQEVARCTPPKLQHFLLTKYGIETGQAK